MALNANMLMKYLFAVLLLIGVSFPALAIEAPEKKKEATKAEAKKDEPSAEAQVAAKSLTPDQTTKLLDIINKGDDEAVQSLPGIGETRAKALVKGRPFAEPLELLKVEGIGDATFARIIAHAKADFPVKEKKKKAKAPAKKKTEEADKKAAKE